MRKNKPFGVLTRSNTNQAVQSQKLAWSLKFWIEKERVYTVRVVKTKALFCSFVFTYADCQLSYAASHFYL